MTDIKVEIEQQGRGMLGCFRALLQELVASSARSRVRTLWLWFFGALMIVLVVLGSLSIKRLDRVFEQVRAQVEFSEPLVTATRKMEIDVLSYLANVRAFQGGYLEGRTLASQDARDVAQDVRDYERLVRTPDQRKLLERFSEQ